MLVYLHITISSKVEDIIETRLASLSYKRGKRYIVEQERDHLPAVGTTLWLEDEDGFSSYFRVEKVREDFLTDKNGYTNPLLFLSLFETDSVDSLLQLIKDGVLD